jgi:hypothetical protein
MTKRLVSAGLVLGLLAGMRAVAVPMDVSGEGDFRVTSTYLWRGQVMGRQPCLQPEVTAGARNMRLDLWGTWDLISDRNTGRRTRVDGTISAWREWERHTVSGGVTAYLWPGRAARDTSEVFVEYGVDALTLPSLAVYYDIDRIHGFYSVFSLAHSVEVVADRVAVDFHTSLGGADRRQLDAMFDYRTPAQKQEQGGASLFSGPSLVDLTGVVSVPVYLEPDVVVMPELTYMTLAASEIRKTVRAKDADVFVFAVCLVAYY